MVAGEPQTASDELLAELRLLRLLRLDRGWTLDCVARRLDTGTSTIHNWETGVRVPRFESVTAYAAMLGYELVLRRRPEPLAVITPAQAARHRAALAAELGFIDDYVPSRPEAGAA
jgi:transcriptional regulator with XRE-family HTH domain